MLIAQYQLGSVMYHQSRSNALARMASLFSCGILVCRLHRLTPPSFRRIQGVIGDASLVLLLLAMVLFTHGVFIANFCFCGLVYGLSSQRGIANAIFSLPVSVLAGCISFPLYLIHVMPLLWLHYNVVHYGVSPDTAHWALGGYLVFIFSVAWLLHVYVERPAHRYGRKTAPVRAGAETVGAL
eukprot:gene54741-biopygen38968